MINMSGSTTAYPIPEYYMDKFVLGYRASDKQRFSDWLLEDLGCNPYTSKQPNGYSDLSVDWMSTELMIRRLLYARKAYHMMNFKEQGDDTLHEKIVLNNFDEPDKILKILSKNKVNRQKHVVLFNLPEILKA